MTIRIEQGISLFTGKFTAAGIPIWVCEPATSPHIGFFAAAVQGYLEIPRGTSEIHDNLFMAQNEYKSAGPR
jgi:hypothetical protein